MAAAAAAEEQWRRRQRPGATLIVRQLATGRDTTFGNISEFAWQDQKHHGKLLAMAISTPDKTGNGIQLFDPQTASLRVLDSSSSTYSNFAWRRDSADLAALKSKTDDKHDGATYIALSWKNLGEPSEASHVYDPTADQSSRRVCAPCLIRRPSWSDDGATSSSGRRVVSESTAPQAADDAEAGSAAPTRGRGRRPARRSTSGTGRTSK